ncbi:hypothetical protein Amet_1844 [Alkaliphilus metalliredigens QYMF]|uniref:Uncharacterized protein n=1 Tax=Alkaliphilus metalliredigens (strain QYMF) TaxID=293826 RepID=A6TP96_ALKMQ|nr:hypothetical protein Amet_1844 [Alkaliphilus metalliredigens QYMF]
MNKKRRKWTPEENQVSEMKKIALLERNESKLTIKRQCELISLPKFTV